MLFVEHLRTCKALWRCGWSTTANVSSFQNLQWWGWWGWWWWWRWWWSLMMIRDLFVAVFYAWLIVWRKNQRRCNERLRLWHIVGSILEVGTECHNQSSRISACDVPSFFVNFSTHQLIMRNRNSLGSRLSRIIVAILQNKSSRLTAELSTLVFAETL